MLYVVSLGRLFDVRVGVDVSCVVLYVMTTISIAWPLADVPRAAASGIAALAAVLVFASIIAHEFAHALVARRYGVRTASITLFVFGGVAVLENEPPSPRAELSIALAGPAMSALLAAIAFGFLALVARPANGAVAQTIAHSIAYVALANAVLAVFNLIPAFPMDGGRVLRALLWRLRGSRADAGAVAAFVGLVFAGGLLIAGLAMALGSRAWSALWYAAIGAFLMRQSWLHWRDAREHERHERKSVQRAA